MFVAFTMVQQILKEVSGAATEEEKASVITEAVFSFLKRTTGSCSLATENHSIQC
jgi:hypothetical protein